MDNTFWVYYESASGRKTVAHRLWKTGPLCGRPRGPITFTAGATHKRCTDCTRLLEEWEALRAEVEKE